MEKKFSRYAYGNFLLWSIFSSLGMTVSTFIDAVLVGNIVGTDGLAAVNIATPVFLLYSLLGVCIGFGANVLIGKRLGSSQIDEANDIFNYQIIFGFAVGVIVLILGVVFRDGIVSMLGARGELFELEKNYISIVLICAPLFVTYQTMAASVRTDANPKLVTISAAVVIITDLSLDLIFMMKLNMGTFGASLSLCIAEFLGLCVLMTHFLRKNALLKFKKVKLKTKYITMLLQNGFGVGSAFAFQAIVMVVFNLLLVSKGGTDGVLNVAFFGVLYTMSTIPLAVFDGSANAVSPVVSIFLGEKDSESILTIRKLAILSVAFFGTIIAGLFILFSKQAILFFGVTESAALQSEILAFRLFAVSILFGGLNAIVVAFWQAIGRSKLAGAMSVFRNFALMLTVGVLLIPRFGVVGLGITYLCSEVICFIVTVCIGITKGSEKLVKDDFKSVNRTFEKTYTIHPESVEQISSDLEGICEEWNIPFKQSYFINFIAEEIILNIAKLGLHDKNSKRYIAIKLIDNNGEYIVRIRDNVHAYNPFESDGDDVDNAVIKMIKRNTKYHEYQRKLAFNYLYFIMDGENI